MVPTPRRTLVAGVGNVFLGDDGFGVAVAARLAGEPMPDGVEVVDVGIRGVHLAYQLLDGYDTLVLVDAMPQDGPPGTLRVVEPSWADVAAAGDDGDPVDAHGMGPDAVLRTIAALAGPLGVTVGRVVVVGCRPADVAEGIGLSPAVAAAVPLAADLVRELVGAAAPATASAGAIGGASHVSRHPG